MKRIIYLLLIFLSQSLLFSQTRFFPTNFYGRWLPLSNDKLFTENKFSWFGGMNFNYPDGQDLPNIVDSEDGLYISINADKQYYFISKQKIACNESYYETITIGDKRYIIIQGGNYYAFRPIDGESNDNKAACALHDLNTDPEFNIRTFKYTGHSSEKNAMLDLAYSWVIDYGGLVTDCIKNVSLSVPFLTETLNNKKITYDTDFLKFRWFFSSVNRGGQRFYYANCTKPMVEGDPGNGVGVELDIEFYIPSDNVVILNGYADWNKQHLYKQNARMKKVKVEGEGFSLEYEFEDYVHFAQIDFPKQVDKVKITVLEVYDGSKWADMAISGIWVNPDVTKTAGTKIAEEYLEYAKQHCIEIVE